MALIEHGVGISFGDCDPAGIVFYPNYFRWMDATFHALLNERVGGHSALCARLRAKGVGLMEASLSFRSPATAGDRIEYRIVDIEWANRSLTIRYEANIDDRRVLEGIERRGVFVEAAGRMAADQVAPLREALGL